jgi:hypothetical protein
MRRIGLVISSLLAAGALFGAAHAFANEPRPDATPDLRPAELKLEVVKHPLLRPIFTPAKATQQGKLDDRLIRPHHTYDASAGLMG